MATGSAQRAPAAAWVSRQAWTLERFGFSPGKLPKRLSNQGAVIRRRPSTGSESR